MEEDTGTTNLTNKTAVCLCGRLHPDCSVNSNSSQIRKCKYRGGDMASYFKVTRVARATSRGMRVSTIHYCSYILYVSVYPLLQ